MKYLDEDIKIGFVFPREEKNQFYKYEVSLGFVSLPKELIFVGNVFVEEGATHIEIDVTDIVRNWRKVLPFESKDYSLLADSLHLKCQVRLYNNWQSFNEEEICMVYRDINEKRSDNTIFQRSSDLVPHIPFKLTDNMPFGVAFDSIFENDTTESIYFNGFDEESIEIPINKKSYNAVFRKLSTLFDGVNTKDYNYIIKVDFPMDEIENTVVQKMGDVEIFLQRFGEYTRDIEGLGLCVAYISNEGVWFFKQAGTNNWYKGGVMFNDNVDINTQYPRVGRITRNERNYYKWSEFNVEIGYTTDYREITTTDNTNSWLKYNTNTVYMYENILSIADRLGVTVVEHSITKVDNFSLTNQNGDLIYSYVDICPSKYYVMWYDRFLGIQSQPFNGKSVYSEDVERNEVMGYSGERRNVYFGVQGKWELTTDWLNDSDYKGFESLWVSPYIYLYDSENDIMRSVILTNNTYTEKKFENEKQLYNLTITVELNNKQHIFN